MWGFITIAIASVGLASATAISPHGDETLPLWDMRHAQDLLSYAEVRLGRHGLVADRGKLADLRRAIATGDAAPISRSSRAVFVDLADDLANGMTPRSARGRFYLSPEEVDRDAILALERSALEGGGIFATLEALAPKHPQYASLQSALMSETDTSRRRTLTVNLERWRWLPRGLGDRYLMVNIPEFVVRDMVGDREVRLHRVIVGKPSTPTPQFAATVSGVILNPSWTVPASIIRESVGALVRRQPALAREKGYEWYRDPDGRLRVTQKPGPGNALGEVKLDMPNPHTIYLHDTPSKELFAKDVRTFSHGCVRVDDALGLAEYLLAGSSWPRERIDQTVMTRKTTSVPLAKPLPVYFVYFTAFADASGTVRFSGDPYALDRKVRLSTAGQDAQVAARPHSLSECSALESTT